MHVCIHDYMYIVSIALPHIKFCMHNVHVYTNIQSSTHRQPEPISSDILDNVKMVQFVGYAPKPAGLHCNQCPYQLSKYHTSNKKTEPESPMMRGMIYVYAQLHTLVFQILYELYMSILTLANR